MVADRDTAALVRGGAEEEEDRNPGIGFAEADKEEVADCDKSRNVMPVDTVTRRAEYNRIPSVLVSIKRVLFWCIGELLDSQAKGMHFGGGQQVALSLCEATDFCNGLGLLLLHKVK